MRTKVHLNYDEAVPEGDEFMCRLVIIHKKEDGGNDKEEHKGKGRSKKKAKHNSASKALKESNILQCFMDGTMLFFFYHFRMSNTPMSSSEALVLTYINMNKSLRTYISAHNLEVLSLQTRKQFKVVLKIVSLP